MYLAAQETSRGWGGPLAILAAAAVFYAGVQVFHRVQEAWGKGRPSPTRRGRPVARVNAQVSSVSDTDDTSGDTNPWWGRIVEIGGHRVRQVGQVMRTGATYDDEIDVALEDQGDGEETLEEFIARGDEEGVPYAEMVRDLMRHYRVSESTAKRRIRDVRAGRS